MSNVICANCGAPGHLLRLCPHPICSYGVICYRLRVDFHTNSVRPEFLMVQRKDSLFMVDLVRGKYDPEDEVYVRKMIAGMTKEEQDLLRRAPPFSELWSHLWSFSHMKNCMTTEFCMARDKFDTLMKRMKSDGDAPGEPFLMYVLRTSESHLAELEWGFGKGRRNVGEQEQTCALREFTEETGVPSSYLYVFPKTLEDSFIGSNGVAYKHTYYLARLIQGGQSGSCDMPIRSAQQAREVSACRWFTLKEGVQRLSGTRVALLENAHRFAVQQVKGRW